jgi:adenylate cyclase
VANNERRLAAIMSAGVAGYSRLMGADESGTLAALKALRADIFAPQVAAHKGRVIKLMSDGTLIT